MAGHVPIVAAHWTYLAGVVLILTTIALRANVVVPAICATFAVALAWTESPVTAFAAIFNASLVAAKELFNIFLVIALMTALLNALKVLRSDIRMVEPFRTVMKGGTSAFVVMGLITYGISLFFWPTPAVPLVSAVLLPAAIAAGLPALVAAMVIAITGQGMALSSDYVIGVAPGISARAAGMGVSVGAVADRALVLSLLTGGVALGLVFLRHRHAFRPPSALLLRRWQERVDDTTTARISTPGTFDKAQIARATEHEPVGPTDAVAVGAVDEPHLFASRLFAVLTPLAFLGVILLLVLSKLEMGLTLRGGAAAAIVGGTAAVLMILATAAAEGFRPMLDRSAAHITDGFVFAFRAMGSVLPIAGFFFTGAGDTAAPILGVPAEGVSHLLFDLAKAAEAWIPHNRVIVTFCVLIAGMITGIDGSGFAGLPLTGALSGALAPTTGMDAATLCAVGQMGAVWTGGGTLIVWSSLIAVAGFARVPAVELVRCLFLPVLAGLAFSTVCAVLLW